MSRCVLVIRFGRRYFVVDDVDVDQNLRAFAASRVSARYRSTRDRKVALVLAHDMASKSQPSHGVRELVFEEIKVPSEYWWTSIDDS